MKRRNNIAVELTPLLDVILIILFLIISQQNAESERVKAEAEMAAAEYDSRIEQLSEEYSQAEEELFNAENTAAGYKSFDELSVIVSVGIKRSPDGTRTVYISENGETSTFKYGWDNLRYGENSLEAVLSGCISGSGENPVFISFNYDEDDIYLRDYTLVTDVLERLHGDNIYIVYNSKISETEENENE